MDSALNIESDMNSLCRAAAEKLVELVNKKSGSFSLALAGGSTPKRLYQLLASDEYRSQIPWQKLKIFFGDERTVTPDHEESNYRMAAEAMLQDVPLNPDQVFRIKGENEPAAAAAEYAELLNDHLERDADGRLQFDLVLIGLGPDGHIASLFPDTDILNEHDKAAAAVWVDKFDTWRISITYPLINRAQNVWLFVAGEGKQDIIEEIFQSGRDTIRYPVQRIDNHGQMICFLDHAAAARLEL